MTMILLLRYFDGCIHYPTLEEHGVGLIFLLRNGQLGFAEPIWKKKTFPKKAPDTSQPNFFPN